MSMYGGYGYGRGYGYGSIINIAIFNILAIILALVGTILLYVLVFPKSKENTLNKFFKFVNDFFSLKYLIIEKIAKFCYIYSTLFIILFGFFMLFGNTFIVGLLTIVLGPILMRLSYELFMLTILLVKNVMEINGKMKGDASGATSQFETTLDIPVPKKASQTPCPNCGNNVKEGATFCPNCGNKMQ